MRTKSGLPVTPTLSLRRRLAAQATTRPEVLYYLAEDKDDDVRREIAANRHTPRHADILLARDDDTQVRCHLAAKIGRLAPNLGDTQSDRLAGLTLRTLEILARDEIVKVRSVLAETLQDIADAPPHILRQLALDEELAVYRPILRNSPMLDDEDLLDIIVKHPVRAAVAEISRRDGVSETVCEAIIESGGKDAVTALLANHSAQIREETLDRLIDQAPTIEAWHEPLAHRPHLNSRAAQKIANFVAESLLAVMRKRTDFDSRTLEAVESEFRRRLQNDKQSPGPEEMAQYPDQSGESAQFSDQATHPQKALVRAQKLEKAGKLSEKTLQRSLQKGEKNFILAALAVKTSLSLALVGRIFDSKNPKGIFALLARARIGPQLTRLIQKKIAHLPPKDVIDPEKTPPSPQEIEWQLTVCQKMFSAQTHTDTQTDTRDELADFSPKTENTDLEPEWARNPQPGKESQNTDLEPEWARNPQTG